MKNLIAKQTEITTPLTQNGIAKSDAQNCKYYSLVIREEITKPRLMGASQDYHDAVAGYEEALADSYCETVASEIPVLEVDYEFFVEKAKKQGKDSKLFPLEDKAEIFLCEIDDSEFGLNFQATRKNKESEEYSSEIVSIRLLDNSLMKYPDQNANSKRDREVAHKAFEDGFISAINLPIKTIAKLKSEGQDSDGKSLK